MSVATQKPNLNQFPTLEKLKKQFSPLIDLEQLQSLPQGTLGRALFDFLSIYDLEPLGRFRRIQLHDCVHALTGYGADLMGEAEVQAFLFATQARPFHLLLGLGISHKIYQQIAAGKIALTPLQVWQRLHQAYQRGQNSTFNLETWQPEQEWSVSVRLLHQQYQLE